MARPTLRVDIAFADNPVTTDDGAGVLTGAANSYFSTPDAASLRITGDIEIVARVKLTDWTPAAEMAVAARYAFLNASYMLSVGPTGTLTMWHTADGASAISQASSIPPFANGTTYWIKATLDVDNGAAGRNYAFYYAADQVAEPTSWTTLSTHTVAGTTSIYAGTQRLEVGTYGGGTWLLAGSVYRTIIRNGIGGTTVADFRPLDARSSTATNWYSVGVAGQVWTRQSAATLSLTPNWTDVSTYVRQSSVEVSRGKEDELQTYATSTCSFVLDNLDRRFDPDYGSGPYNLTGRKQVAVGAVWNNVYYPLFRGVLESFPQVFSGANVDATVPITAYDFLTYLAEQVFEDAAYVYARDTLGDLGVAYRIRTDRQWNDEVTGGSIYRRRGVPADGTQMGVGPGTPVLFDGSTVFTWAATGAADGIQSNTSGGWSFWVQTTTVASTAPYLRTIIQSVEQNTGTTNKTARIGINSTGRLEVDHPGSLGTLNTKSDTPINDGAPHHCMVFMATRAAGAAVYYRIFIDGIDSTGSFSDAPNPGYDNQNAGAITYVGGSDPIFAALGDQRFVGTLQDVYGFRESLTITDAQVKAFQQLAAGSVYESTGTRMSRLLTLGGFPSGLTDVTATSYGNTSEIDTFGQSALSQLQLIADSEQGRLFCAADGRITLQDRFWWSAGGATTAATFNDDGTNLRFASVGADRPLREVQNDITVTGTGGITGNAADATSKASYGTRSASVSTVLASQVEVESMATGLLALRKDAKTRLSRIEVKPERDSSWATVLALDIGDRAVVKYMPARRAGSTSQITATVLLERVDWAVSGNEWTLSILGSPVPSYNPFILDSSSLDGANLLGF